MGVTASVVVALGFATGVYFLAQPAPPAMSSTQTTLTEPSSTSSIFSVSTQSSSSHAGLYELEFVQEARCTYGGWVYPWGVLLNGTTSRTIVEPSNETLGLLYNNDPNNASYSQIVFWVPNGVYNYTVLPSKYFSQSGTVTILGNNTQINVFQSLLAMGCTSTTVAKSP